MNRIGIVVLKCHPEPFATLEGKLREGLEGKLREGSAFAAVTADPPRCSG